MKNNPSLWKQFKRRFLELMFDISVAFLIFFFGRHDKKRWVIGLGPMTVAPGTTGTFSAVPQVLFRGEQLINTGDTGLTLDGLFVGNKTQLPIPHGTGSGVPTQMFAATVMGSELLMDWCEPALHITVQVHNPTDQEKKFSMSIVGKAFFPRFGKL